MTLSNQYVFLTTDVDGFRTCRDTRSATGMTIIMCTRGHIDVYMYGEMVRVAKDDLFVRIPSYDFELGPYQMSDDYEFMQVTIDGRIFEQIMYDHIRVEPNWYAKQEYVKAHPVFHLSEASQEFVHAYFHLLDLQMKDKATDYRMQIMKMQLKAATMEMLNYIDKLAVIPADASTARISVNQSDYTFREFMRMLQQYPHKREVQWYARMIEISPKYLSEICKERSGKSASEWIADITVSELKHLLRHTTMSIQEIAKYMEFPNTSFFCQYTKKHTGMSPNHFRREKQQ